MLTCEVTRAPNFKKVLQISEKFCKKHPTSTNNGDLQGGFDFFLTYDFATYKIVSLTSQWKVFVKKFEFPEFHVLNKDFFDFPG